MTRSATKTSYHHGNLREQLIAATRELVEAKGPDGFSVSEACRTAGVSTAAPYKHFSDRLEMLRAVAMQGFAEMSEAFDAAVEGLPPGSIDAITAIGVAYVHFAEANPGLFRMMFAATEDTPETEEAGHDCYEKVLHQIALHLGKSEVDNDVLKAGFPLWTFVHGLAFLRIDGKADFGEVPLSVEELTRMSTERLLVG